MPTTRTTYFAVFITCLSLLGFGLYLQYGKGIEPCPLCILQRIAYLSVALIALIAAVHGPGRIMNRIYSGLMIVAALCGGGVAVRQVWLQHLPPDQVPECGPGLQYMLDSFPFAEALKLVLTGSGECAKVLWTFLGFSIPEWSLLCFFFLTVVGIILILGKTRSS